MRVLVIRPEPSAQRTARKLTSLGHDPIVLPLAAAENDTDGTREALKEPHSSLAITSAQAVRVLQSLGPELDRHLLSTVFAVGRSTARVATETGFRTVLTAEGDGRELADFIAAHYRNFGTPVEPTLYLAGIPRAPNFEARLKEHDIRFKTVDSYRMKPIRPPRATLRPILLDGRPDAILFHSRESAVRFFQLPMVEEYPDQLQSTLLLCMSRNVATAVPERFAASVVVASRPDEDSLLDLL
ncbi:uroporphyrinogen-III synthase [Sinorhizobium sp. BG8]|uniref:uroporphyrinogen-III synthase n=1 Tax=Sinorhizobium sp. BG8 TaxID=2613773 RepID=UPI00193DE842|nr:uroporphyrinogen-III synthase [Sinorhizobium sp. BG8]QRM53454.1 uroporphyrinogen-III synthase [Sinorhizobium sp. BG8]